MRVVLVVLLAVTSGTTGCGDDSAVSDAAPLWDADSILAQAVVDPSFTPCPAGWFESERGGLRRCDAFPEGGPADCPPGEAHFVGEPSCRIVGSVCPTGRFPDADDLGSDRPYIFVDAAALPGADGTRTSPFMTIAAALLVAEEATIVLAGGDYLGAIEIVKPGIELRGACARDVRLTNVDDRWTVSTPGHPIVLRDLTIGPGGAGAVEGSEIEMHGVIATGTSRRSAVLGTVDGVEVVIRSAGGDAIEAQAGSRLRRSVIERGQGTGIAAFGRDVRLSDVAIHQQGGPAILAESADIELERVALLDTRCIGIDISGTVGPARLVARDLQIADVEPGNCVTQPSSTTYDGTGRGISATDADLDLERVTIERAREVGLFVQDVRGSIVDFSVQDVVPHATNSINGIGAAFLGAELELRRARFANNHEVGLAVADGVLTAEDVAIVETRARPQVGTGGRGLDVRDAAQITIERVHLERNREVALLVMDGVTATVRDARVFETYARSCADSTCSDVPFGTAIIAAADAALAVERFELRSGPQCGIYFDGADADFRSGSVSGFAAGVCLARDGFDVARLEEDVRFVDNGVNLQALVLPIPEPIAGL